MKTPHADDGAPLQLMQAKPALASTTITSPSTAQSVTLQGGTRFVRVVSLNQATYMKFASGVTTSNNGFDQIIPAGGVLDFDLKEFPGGVPTTLSFIQQAANSTVIVIEI
ncbi:MAG: hypothetical protein KGL39_35295 [Patescibacteria group bacterium]|nr:hypothetical protein [Patescibacteria group bacterium]